MALTILEAAKLNSGNVIRDAVIEIYAQNSDILRTLPFENIPGNAMKYNQEKTLPGIGFRGVNASWTAYTGVLNPKTESLVIAGGEIKVDTFIVDTMGEDQRAVQEAMKIKALALNFTLKFIKGDSVSQSKEFDGLQVRLTGDQLIAAGSTSLGDALSLLKLDELIDAVDDPTHLIMNKTMRRLLTKAARTTSVGGYVNYEQDEFGKRLTTYNDLPILIADKDNTDAQILPFTEACPGGGSTGTSIYCVNFSEGMLTGLQNEKEMIVEDLGKMQSEPSYLTRVEWYVSITLWHPRAAARLYGIKNAAVTA